MAQLYFRYSTMNAGKSIEVQKVAFNYEERGQHPLVFTSALDTRFGKNKVASRIGLQRKALPINEETNIYNIVKEYHEALRVDAVIIDECQFLKKHHILQLTDIVDILNIPVLCYGLRTDFRGELFEGSYWLLALADKIEEIKTICWCGKKAIINARIVNGEIVKEGEQIQVGGNDLYIPLCRKHFKEGKFVPFKKVDKDLITMYQEYQSNNKA